MISVISLGAGVQSSTKALKAAHHELGRLPDFALFADTQSEPASVYRWLDWLEKQLPYPVIRVTHGNLGRDLTQTRVSKEGRRYWTNFIPFFCADETGKKVGIFPRKCTSDYKIRVMIRYLRTQVDLKPWRARFRSELKAYAAFRRAERSAKRDKTAMPKFPQEAWDAMQADSLVEQWIGISTDEADRMKRSQEPWIRHRWPLIEQGTSRAQCVTWMVDKGYPKPPRSACKFCPYHSDEEWLRLKQDEPDDFAEAVAIERAAAAAAAAAKDASTFRRPFLHASCVPLGEVPFEKLVAERKDAKTRQADLFSEDCEGMCGV